MDIIFYIFLGRQILDLRIWYSPLKYIASLLSDAIYEITPCYWYLRSPILHSLSHTQALIPCTYLIPKFSPSISAPSPPSRDQILEDKVEDSTIYS